MSGLNQTLVQLTELEAWKLKALVTELAQLEGQLQALSTKHRTVLAKQRGFWTELAARYAFEPTTAYGLDEDTFTLERVDGPPGDGTAS